MNKISVNLLLTLSALLMVVSCDQQSLSSQTNSTSQQNLSAQQSSSAQQNSSLQQNQPQKETAIEMPEDSGSGAVKQGKPVLYQVFTRLFGNKNTTYKPWGTLQENGVGKFNDFTDKALEGIKELGVTHIWYTGVLHHAVINDYTEYGISLDDPDVVKGRAGSPYAVKDYYNVNPDLAVDPGNRLQEFEALIQRTHQHGLKVIIDIVPNHVARNYQSISKPDGVEDFGASDNDTVEYQRNNNFYYIVGQSFKVPEAKDGYQPLGGEPHPLADGVFHETPAKWTGNGSRKAQPDSNDWYETVKINYGVKPDGSADFPRLPEGFENKGIEAHYNFWQQQQVPSSWIKYRQIVEYWLDKGVDGFRFDVAELVPVEFWSYLNSAIKMKKANSFLLAEIYQPHLYRDFIHLGKMDYLYDKVDFYDTIKAIMQGKEATSKLIDIQNKYSDIEQYLLHFLENHDEQRIASPEFVGDPNVAKPAMVVSALISRSPTMLYFAQALGEPASGDAGFGDPSRTTIFDYWAVPSLQRWMNDGAFDGAKLTPAEKQLRDFYVRLMNISANHPAFNGDFHSLHASNLEATAGYNNRLLSFARWNDDEHFIIVSNFDRDKGYQFELNVDDELIEQWKLEEGEYDLIDVLSKETKSKLIVKEQKSIIKVDLKPLQSYIFNLSL